jgi:hypothetical protein
MEKLTIDKNGFMNFSDRKSQLFCKETRDLICSDWCPLWELSFYKDNDFPYELEICECKVYFFKQLEDNREKPE